MLGDRPPTFIRNSAMIAQLHFFVHNPAEQGITLIGHNRDVISSCLCVIIILQPDGTTMVFLWIKFHGSFIILLRRSDDPVPLITLSSTHNNIYLHILCSRVPGRGLCVGHLTCLFASRGYLPAPPPINIFPHNNIRPGTDVICCPRNSIPWQPRLKRTERNSFVGLENWILQA